MNRLINLRSELSMMGTPYFLFKDKESGAEIRCIDTFGKFSDRLFSNIIHSLNITDDTIAFELHKNLDAITSLTIIQSNKVVNYRVYGLNEAIANKLENAT